MEWEILLDLFINFIKSIIGVDEKELKKEIPIIIKDIEIIQSYKYSSYLNLLRKYLVNTYNIIVNKKKGTLDDIYKYASVLQCVFDSKLEDFNYKIDTGVQRENVKINKFNSLKKIILPSFFKGKLKSHIWKYDLIRPLFGVGWCQNSECPVNSNFNIDYLKYGEEEFFSGLISNIINKKFNFIKYAYSSWSRRLRLERFDISIVLLQKIFPLLYFNFLRGGKDPFFIFFDNKYFDMSSMKFLLPCVGRGSPLLVNNNSYTDIVYCLISYSSVYKDRKLGVKATIKKKMKKKWNRKDLIYMCKFIY